MISVTKMNLGHISQRNADKALGQERYSLQYGCCWKNIRQGLNIKRKITLAPNPITPRRVTPTTKSERDKLELGISGYIHFCQKTLRNLASF